MTDNQGIAEITIKMWLEGWDTFSGDRLRDKSFGANLRFVAASSTDI